MAESVAVGSAPDLRTMASTVRVVVPRPVTELLDALTNGAPVGPATATVGGHSNLTFHTTVDGQPVVVKAATEEIKRVDLRREARVLRGLSEMDPMPVAVPDVVAHGDADGVTVTIVREVPGESGLAAVEQRATSTLVGRAAVVGRALNRLHTSAVPPDPAADAFLSDRLPGHTELLGQLELEPAMESEMVVALRAPSLRRGLAFVHGDAGFHNTLWSTSPGGGRLAALLDWEFAGWGNPLTDVAWIWWTMQFRSLHPSVWESFSDAYGRSALRSIGTATEMQQLVRAQIISLLVRTPTGSGVRDVWLRRWLDLDSMADPVI